MVIGLALGDFERGKGLARAAGHDELAAVVVLEAFDDVLKRFLLVGTQLALGDEDLPGLEKAVPVDVSLF